MLSTTVTLTGTAAADAFGLTLNGTDVQFYVNAALTQTVPASQLAGLTIDGGGGADTLAVTAAGVTVPLDATATPTLALTVAAGTVAVAAPASLAAATVAAGATLDLTGPGTLAGPVAVAGTLQVDNGGAAAATTTLSGAVTTSGSATLDVTAGTLAVPGTVAPAAGSALAIDGPGTLAMTATDWDLAGVTVTQSAGTVATEGLRIGCGGTAPAAYDLTGGTLDMTTVSVGCYGTGTLDQSGGTVADPDGGSVGWSCQGTLVQTGGTATYGTLYLGWEAGDGTLDLSGGTTHLTGSLFAGQRTAGRAQVTLSGTADLTVDGGETLGFGGTVTVDQSGGTNAADGITLGWTSPAAYDQTGGTVAVGGGGLSLGYFGDAAGTYALSAGALADAGGLDIGVFSAAPSTFAQTGGSTTVAALFVGGFGPGSMAVSGGSVAVADNVSVGLDAPGTLALSGTGSLATAAALYVSGDGGTGNPDAAGTLTLADAARLTTQQTYVGYTAPATFTQTGGTDTTQTLVLDGPSGRTAAYTVSAGTVAAALTLDAYAPAADGPAAVDEGTPYALGLFGTASTTHWAVNWGDGTPTAAVPGTPPSAAHTYASGGNSYTIAPTAYDANNTAAAAPAVPVLVNDVPADVTPPPLESVDVGQPAAIAEPFTDPGTAQTHTATVDWGDGTTTAATVVESAGSGTVSSPGHAYATPGTYQAELAVTDSGGAVAAVPFTVIVSAPAVAGPAAVAAGPDEVDLSWASAGGRVLRSDDGGQTFGVMVDTDAGTYVDRSVTGGRTYEYEVEDVDDGTTSAPVAVATPADVPTRPSAAAADDASVTVGWSAASAEDPFVEVDRRPAGGGTWAPVALVDASDGTYTDTGLTQATGYDYRLRAVGAADADGTTAGDDDPTDSAYSAALTATTAPTTPDDPTDVTATAADPGEIDLSWADDSTAITDYLVTVTPDDGSDPTEATVPATRTTYAATGLSPDQGYALAVTADNDVGGDAADVRSSAVPAPAQTEFGGVVAGGATLSATGLSAVAEGSALTVDLSAAEAAGTSAAPITGWSVDWGAQTDYPTGATATDTLPFPTDGSAPPATVQVTAYDADGNAFALPAITVGYVPAGPTGLTAAVGTSGEVDLSWTDNSVVAGADVIVSAATGGGYTVLGDYADDGSGTFPATGLTPGLAYTFEVQESDGGNTSAAATVTATPTADALAATGGPAAEGGGYTLDLSDTAADGSAGTAVAHWSVDWGDGSPPSAVTGATTTASHVFAAGTADAGVGVTAVGTGGVPYPLAPVDVPVTPLPPTGLTVTQDASGAVDLTWAVPSSLSPSIEVYRSPAGGNDWAQLAVLDPGTTTYADPTASGSEGYDYKVTADTGYATADSAVATVDTAPGTPDAPADLDAEPDPTGGVDLTWSDPGTVAGDLVVQRSTDGGATWTAVATLAATATSYTDTAAPAGGAAEYQVTAQAASGGGAAASSTASAGIVPAQQAAPGTGKITNLQAQQADLDGVCQSITLTWSYSGGDATGYELEVEQVTGRTTPENFSLADGGYIQNPAVNSFTFYGETGQPLFAGQQFAFRVRADRTDGTVSDYAGTSVTAEGDVPTLKATAVAAHKDSSGNPVPPAVLLDVGYTADKSTTTPDPDQYQYEVRPAVGTGWVEADAGNSDTYSGDLYNYSRHEQAQIVFGSIPGIVPGASYVYRARVHVGRNSGPWSAAEPATLPVDPNGGPAAIIDNPAVTASVNADGSVTVSWTGGGPNISAGLGISTSDTAVMTPATRLFTDVLDPGVTQTTLPPPSAGGLAADGSTYHVYVRLQGSDPQSGAQIIDWGAKDLVLGNAPVLPPAVPGLVRGIYDKTTPHGAVRISWQNTPNNESGFRLSISDGNRVYNFNTGIDETSFTYHPKTLGPYVIKVQAFNAAGFSAQITPTCSCIGGPDITRHLLLIEARLTAFANSPDGSGALNEFYWETNPFNNRDIAPLRGQYARSPNNYGCCLTILRPSRFRSTSISNPR